MKVKTLTFSIVLGLIYFLFFSPIAYLPTQSLFKYGGLLFVGIFLLFHIGIFFKKEYLPINLMVLLFAVWVIVGGYLNKNQGIERNTFLASIVGMGTMIEVFLLLQYTVETKNFPLLFNLYYYLTLLTVIVTDLLIIFAPSVALNYGNYLVGTKFQVSYLHLQLLVFFLLRTRTKKQSEVKIYVFSAVYFLWAALIAFFINCNTGLVASFIYIVVYFLFLRKKGLLANPLVMIVFLLVNCSFLFVFRSVLDNELVQYIIVEVFDTSLTLTGRMDIYQMLPKILEGHLLWGYGYGSAYEICLGLMGFADTQNGLIQWLLQIGIPAFILLLMIFFVCFSRAKGATQFIYPAVVMIYSYSLIASVEITINEQFLFWMALICAASCYKGIENEEKEDLFMETE